jgi:hypothetical protein
MTSLSINYLAVVAAAVAGFLVGWGWYAVFGKVWMESLGKTKEDCRPTPLPFIIAGVACLYNGLDARQPTDGPFGGHHRT